MKVEVGNGKVEGAAKKVMELLEMILMRGMVFELQGAVNRYISKEFWYRITIFLQIQVFLKREVLTLHT